MPRCTQNRLVFLTSVCRDAPSTPGACCCPGADDCYATLHSTFPTAQSCRCSIGEGLHFQPYRRLSRDGVLQEAQLPRGSAKKAHTLPPAAARTCIGGAILYRQCCVQTDLLFFLGRLSTTTPFRRLLTRTSVKKAPNGQRNGGGKAAARNRRGSRGKSVGEPASLHSSLHGMTDFRLIPRWSFFTQALREPEEKLRTSIGVSRGGSLVAWVCSSPWLIQRRCAVCGVTRNQGRLVSSVDAAAGEEEEGAWGRGVVC